MKENTCYDKLINGVNENGTIVFYGKKNPMRAFLRLSLIHISEPTRR